MESLWEMVGRPGGGVPPRRRIDPQQCSLFGSGLFLLLFIST